MKKKIAFFDFDGTITTKDTLLELIRFHKGSFSFYLGFIVNSPWILAYKFRLISNQRAKERILAWFFGGWTIERFNAVCQAFSTDHLPSLLREKALREISLLKETGAEIIVVSASPENWIRQWAERLEIRLIATRLVLDDGRLTGRILDRNCYGEEKARRIRQDWDLGAYDEIYAYGDSSGDRPMLALATFPFFKPFR